MHGHAYAYIHTCTHTHARTHARTHTHARTRARAITHTHTRAQSHTCMNVHMCVHAWLIPASWQSSQWTPNGCTSQSKPLLCLQSMEPISVEELKAEKCPRISAEDLVELGELSGPAFSRSPTKKRQNSKPMILMVDVRAQEEYPWLQRWMQCCWLCGRLG